MKENCNVSEGAEQTGERGLRLIREGKIRNHKLKNCSSIHTGEIEMQEQQNYLTFLPSKNAYFVYDLVGRR